MDFFEAACDSGYEWHESRTGVDILRLHFFAIGIFNADWVLFSYNPRFGCMDGTTRGLTKAKLRLRRSL